MKTLKLTDELHSELKIIAATKKTSLQELINTILQGYITNRGEDASIPIEQSSTPNHSDYPPNHSDDTPDDKLMNYYKHNQHNVESTRTLLGCSLKDAIVLTMDADDVLKKYQ